MNPEISQSITRVFTTLASKSSTNIHGFVQGNILELMEAVALMTVTRFSRKKVITVSVDRIEYRKAPYEKVIIELVGEVISVASSAIDVAVVVYAEPMYERGRDQIGTAEFSFKISGKKYQSHQSIRGSQPEALKEFVGGETELRNLLNLQLSPRTVGRATLYNYLEKLDIRKSLYTNQDFNLVIEHIRNLKPTRKQRQ